MMRRRSSPPHLDQGRRHLVHFPSRGLPLPQQPARHVVEGHRPRCDAFSSSSSSSLSSSSTSSRWRPASGSRHLLRAALAVAAGLAAISMASPSPACSSTSPASSPSPSSSSSLPPGWGHREEGRRDEGHEGHRATPPRPTTHLFGRSPLPHESMQRRENAQDGDDGAAGNGNGRGGERVEAKERGNEESSKEKRRREKREKKEARKKRKVMKHAPKEVMENSEESGAGDQAAGHAVASQTPYEEPERRPPGYGISAGDSLGGEQGSGEVRRAQPHPVSPLRLKQAVVITRHGLRTPLSLLPGDTSVWRCEHYQLSLLTQHPPSDPSSAPIQSHASESSSQASGPSNPAEAPRSQPVIYHTSDELKEVVESNMLTRKLYLSDRQKLRGNCHTGQLTSLGLKQMKELGDILRKRYVEQFGLLPERFDGRRVFFRSTPTNRTFDSAQSLIWGLYPPETRPAGTEGIVEIHMIEPVEENMYPRSRCERIDEIKKLVRKSQTYLQHQEARKQLEEDVQKALGRSVRSWSALHSTLECLQRHGYSLPPGWDTQLAERIAEEASWEMSVRFSSQTVCRLGIGRFVDDVLQRLQQAVDNADDVRFALYSGHDNTLSPFLNAFRVSDGHHPPMAGELYADGQDQHWVRFMYNGKEVFLKDFEHELDTKDGDGNAGIVRNAEKVLAAYATNDPRPALSHREEVDVVVGRSSQKEMLALCPYEEFRRISSYLIPVDYEKECAIDEASAEK